MFIFQIFSYNKMDPIFENGKYQVIKSWSGKVKTITSKDFHSVFGSGQYNIPEGALVFQSSNVDCFWSIGGAKYKKTCTLELLQLPGQNQFKINW